MATIDSNIWWSASFGLILVSVDLSGLEVEFNYTKCESCCNQHSLSYTCWSFNFIRCIVHHIELFPKLFMTLWSWMFQVVRLYFWWVSKILGSVHKIVELMNVAREPYLARESMQWSPWINLVFLFCPVNNLFEHLL